MSAHLYNLLGGTTARSHNKLHVASVTGICCVASCSQPSQNASIAVSMNRHGHLICIDSVIECSTLLHVAVLFATPRHYRQPDVPQELAWSYMQASPSSDLKGRCLTASASERTSSARSLLIGLRRKQTPGLANSIDIVSVAINRLCTFDHFI